MLTREKLTIHHIGGMNGARCFPIINCFEKDIINVLYEANEEEIEGIYDRNKSLPSELHVIPFCIWKCEEKISFNLMKDRHASSIFQLDPKYKDYTSTHTPSHDYQLGDAFQTDKTIEVNAYSLDYLYETGQMKTPPIDFLSLDTQGSEFDILSGAKSCLDEVLGVMTEVEMLKVYNGQKTFGDISNFLTSIDFYMINLFDRKYISPKRTPLGLRGTGILFSCDVLFLKDPRKIISSSREDKIIKLKKLAFMAIVYSQAELAEVCFDLIVEEDGLNFWFEGEESSINTFILEYYQLGRSFRTFPPSFSEVCNFDGSPKKVNRLYELKMTLLKPFHKILVRLPVIQAVYTRGIINTIKLLFFNDLEKLLVKHELRLVAKDLRRRRCQNN
jgi:FkbM family methyltransferase